MFLPHDKIRIFVSSTLGECKEERIQARRAIDSLNHLPVMFEDSGARPHPPREMYLRALDNSQFFVGIYREKYGQLIPGMTISGLEDEFRYATAKGMDLLLYQKSDGTREEQLERLVAEMKTQFSLGTYGVPSDLYERIRDDVESLVSTYVLGGQREAGLRPTNPREVLDQLAPAGGRINREEVEEQFISAVVDHHAVVLRGSLGSGKTVFLAQLAEKYGWVFVQCGQRTPREIAAEAANGIRALTGEPSVRFLLLENAIDDIRQTWHRLESVVIVFDDVNDPAPIVALRQVLTLSDKKSLVASSRDGILGAEFAEFECPRFSKNEIDSYLRVNRPVAAEKSEIEELEALSNGSPLYLRYYAEGEPRQFEKTLRQFELRSWKRLATRCREAIGYIALSPRPLSLRQLLAVMASENESPEDIAVLLDGASRFSVETSQGYTIFHPHARETIRQVIAASPQRLALYAARLASMFEKQRDYSAAFVVLEDIDKKAAERLMPRAASHAASQGDVRTSISILLKSVERAKTAGDLKQVRAMQIAYAQALSHAGKVEEALSKLDEAEKLPADENELFPLAEVRLSVRAWAKGGKDVIDELRALKEKYSSQGRNWDAGRMALEISAATIRSARYQEGIADAKYAVEAFKETGDKYGERVAKLNLLSLSSMVEGEEELANRLLKEFEEEANIPPRQRAALCNVLSRKARESGDVAAAKEYALEAIAIGEDLGDVSVVCTNKIVLGNAYRDDGDVDRALLLYEETDKKAKEAGFVQIEAHAQELIASCLNQKGNYSRAEHHALYAISLSQGGVSPRTEIEANEELAKACERSNVEMAVTTWLHAAELERALGNVNDCIEKFLRAARLTYQSKSRGVYVEAYSRIFLGKFEDTEGEESLLEKFVNGFWPLMDSLSLESVFEAATYHGRLLFSDLDVAFSRQAYLEILYGLKRGSASSEEFLVRRLRALLALTMSLPFGTLKMRDIARVAERIARLTSGMSFRAHTDGAAHWSVEVPLGRPVLATISQVGDRSDVSLVALCVALLLRAYGSDVSTRVLSGAAPIRSEANIQILSHEEAKETGLPLQQIGLTTMDHSSAVSRSANPLDPACPIVVFTRADLVQEWLLGSGRGNAGQVLMAEVLIELVYHLFAGEVELELLRPKFIRLVRETVI